MKITSIGIQARNRDRVNVGVDGKYRFSLDISQVIELGVKQGREIDDEQLAELMRESEYGKLYTKTVEYCFMRPRSQREVRDYLYKKTLTTKHKTKKGDVKEREGISVGLTERVLARLIEKGHIDDEKFAHWWVENRNQRKGSSLRKLRSELVAKGIASQTIEAAIAESERSDDEEIIKIIAKKQSRYPDEQKLIAYLARQGFSCEDIKRALTQDENID